MKDKGIIRQVKLKCNSETCKGKLTDHKVIEYPDGQDYRCMNCTVKYFIPNKEKK